MHDFVGRLLADERKSSSMLIYWQRSVMSENHGPVPIEDWPLLLDAWRTLLRQWIGKRDKIDAAVSELSLTVLQLSEFDAATSDRLLARIGRRFQRVDASLSKVDTTGFDTVGLTAAELQELRRRCWPLSAPQREQRWRTAESLESAAFDDCRGEIDPLDIVDSVCRFLGDTCNVGGVEFTPLDLNEREAEILVWLCIDGDLSQSALAGLIGVDRSTVSRELSRIRSAVVVAALLAQPGC